MPDAAPSSAVPVATATVQVTVPKVRLTRFRVRDFRGVEDLTLDLGSTTTVLLGENNVGKSSLLEALDVALGDRFAATTDLRVQQSSGVVPRFLIDLEMAPWSGLKFDPEVTDLLGIAIREDAATKAQVYRLRVIGEPDETQRTIRVRRGFISDWTDAHSTPFLDELSLTHRRALWFSLLDAQRDLVADLRARGSSWGKLLRRIQLEPVAKKAFEGQLNTLSQSIMTALPDTGALASAVGRLQSVLAGQVSSSRLALLPATLDDLWRTTDLLVQSSGHAELPIGLQGMGARSLASLLAFRAWLSAEIQISTEPPLLVVTGFEEPEAHLHPQAQRAVLREIREVPGQKLVSTHSPHLAAASELDDFRVIRRHASVQVFSAQGISKTAKPDSLINVRRFCLSRNGDMLFARLVILGEGDTESGFLPEVAASWWRARPEELGVAIVPLDGVKNTHTFVSFLHKIGIPWIVLTDGDEAGDQARATLAGDPALSALEPVRFLQLSSNGTKVDFENFLANESPATVCRALAANEKHAAALLKEDKASMVARLQQEKAVRSRRLGEEFAKVWVPGAFPEALKQLFTTADGLLGVC